MQKTQISILFILLTALLLAGTGTAAAAVPQETYCPGQILVQYDADVPLPAVEILHNFSSLVPGLQLIRIPDGMTVEDAVAYYERIPGVVFAEPDYLRVTAGIVEPDDPYFKYQWHLQNTGPGQKTIPYTKRPDDYEQPETAVAGADIQALDAWNITNGSKDILVGIIDSGVMYTHEDLVANIWTNPKEIPDNGLDDDENGYIDDVHGWNFGANNSNPMDYDGHGTHCAGILGAVGNNGAGVTGVAPNVTIMPLKIGNSKKEFTISKTLRAIEYGYAAGARIFSCSYGGKISSTSEQTVIAAANASLFVCAAGNGHQNVDSAQTAVYPACYNLPNILTVAATTYNDTLASYSNYGGKSVHVAAPGTRILSTYPDGTTAEYHRDTDMDWYSYQKDTPQQEKVFRNLRPVSLDTNNDTIISFPVSYTLSETAQAGYYLTDRPFESFSSLDEMKQNALLSGTYSGSAEEETRIYLSKEWIKNVSAPVYIGLALATNNENSTLQIGDTLKILGRINDPVSIYEALCGTSMATPVVAGTAVLVLSRNPDLTPVQLKEILMNSVEQSDKLRDYVITGGRVNACLAVNNAVAKPEQTKAAVPLAGLAAGLAAAALLRWRR